MLACYAARAEAVARARAGDGPDPDRGQGHPPDRRTRATTSRRSTAPRRSSPRTSRWTRCRSSGPQLVDAGVLTPEAEERIDAAIKAAVHDATEYAEAQPDPSPSTAMKWVYAEDWPSEDAAAVGVGRERRGAPTDAELGRGEIAD